MYTYYNLYMVIYIEMEDDLMKMYTKIATHKITEFNCMFFIHDFKMNHVNKNNEFRINKN